MKRPTSTAKWLKLTLLGSLVVALSACADDPVTLFERAKERERNGDRVGAVLELKAGIAKDPSSAEMRFALGRLYNAVFDHVSAEKELRKALDLGLVSSGDVQVELAVALFEQRKWAELLSDVKTAPAYGIPQRATIIALRGRAQKIIGQDAAARTSLQEATAVDREVPDVILLAAQLAATDDNDKARAFELVNRLLARDPSHLKALIFKGAMHVRDRDYEAAVATYEKMLSVRPEHFSAHLNRSWLLLELGRLDDAEKGAKALLKLYPNEHQALTQLAAVYLAQQRAREALEIVSAVQRAQPQYGLAVLIEGLAHAKAESMLQAANVLRRYLSIEPRDAFGRRALARVLLNLGEPLQAQEALAPVLEDRRPDPAAFTLAADIAAYLGRVDEARGWYEKAMKLSPDDLAAASKYGVLQVFSGHIDHGARLLEKVVEKMPSASSVDEVLLMNYISRRRFQEAEQALVTLQKRDPKSPISSNLRGIYFLATGETGKAIESFEAALAKNPAFFPAADNLAKIDLMKGQVDAARKRYLAVLAADERRFDAMMTLASLEQRFGRLHEARALLERAAKLHPNALSPRIMAAKLYLLQADTDRASVASEEMLASNPQDPRVLLLAGEVRQAKGNFASAIQVLTRLVQTQPNSEEALVHLARAQLEAKRIRDAEASLRKALELQPRYGLAQMALASLMVREGRADEALKFARQIQKTQPKAPMGHLIEAELHEAQKRWRDAIASYRTALAIAPNGDYAVRLYRARKASGEQNVALRDLQEWTQRHPVDQFARKVLAHELVSAGEYKRAASQYETFVKLNANDFDALNRLAWTYFKIGDVRALEIAERAYVLNSNSPYVIDTLGWILVSRGDVERGLPILRNAAKLAPRNPEIRYHYAVALGKAGSKDLARKELSEALALGQTFPDEGAARALLATMR